MSDITVTAADVRPLAGAMVLRFEAGAALDVGAVVYVDSDGNVQETDGDAIETTLPCVGIVVAALDGDDDAADGEKVDVVVRGPVAGFSSMTPGALGYVSDGAGLLATTVVDNGFIVGYAESASVFYVRPETIHLTEQG